MTRRLQALLLLLMTSSACNQPPLIPAPANTGPELEAIQLSQGLMSPYRLPGEAQETYRLQDRLAHYRVPGVAIAVIDGGELRWAKAWGLRRAGTEDALSPDDQFQAASIAKALTATLVLREVDAGTWELDDALPSDVLPSELGDLGRPTLRRLLAHGAGLLPQGYQGYAPEADLPSLDAVLRGDELNAGVRALPQGAPWMYSGAGYQVLQAWLEHETGRALGDSVSDELTTPLEMSRTAFAVAPQAPFAVGHDAQGRALDSDYFRFPQLAAAGLWSTAGDLARWLIDVQKAHAGKPGRRLKKDTARLALSPQEPSPWGLGFQLGGAGQSRWFAHSGGNAGYPALALGFVSSGHGAVILTNGDGGQALIREILTGLAAVYDWPTFQQEVLPVEAAGVEASDVPVGTYDLPAFPGKTFNLRLDDDGKVRGSLFGRDAELLPLQDGRWIAPQAEYELRPKGDGSLALRWFPNLRFDAVPRPAESLEDPGDPGNESDSVP